VTVATLRNWYTGLAIVGLAITTVACGSDEQSSSTTAAAEASSDGTEAEAGYELVADSEVTAGLQATVADATALAGRIGSGATVDDYEVVFEGWEGYEGTVKQNEVDIYLAIEDALAALKGAVEDEDAEAGTAAVADLQDAADQYLELHP